MLLAAIVLTQMVDVSVCLIFRATQIFDSNTSSLILQVPQAEAGGMECGQL